MRALVTGSAGFVGQYLVAHLESCGDTVTTTDRIDGGPDLLDSPGIANLIAAAAPEVVFHLAGQADVAASWNDPVGTLRANAEGTMNVLAAAREVGASRVITVTSADVYGTVATNDLPVGEETPMRPVSPYAASKAAGDLVALQAHLGHGQDVIRARSFNHLGRGQSDRFACPALASRIAKNEQSGDAVVQVGNLDARRDFTDVRDVVRAYRMLALDGRAGTAYNVCSGQAVAISEIAKRLLSMAVHPMRLEPDQSLLRPTDVAELRGDPSRLQSHTGWVPEYALDDTLAEVLEDWRERLSADLPAD
ncbi:MAG: GDP-mannose 4,6-dehydratase [Actinomycetota bacterium]|nr:GDP-mannose 4,6-dehydratase [Actinomycetota bacterium]